LRYLLFNSKPNILPHSSRSQPVPLSEDTIQRMEDYFLGRVPEKVMRDCKKERPEMRIQDYGSD
uniref:hypothetical protein n=1 Tax=uncultured Acetatifactor sp. TaxID=1671927 RepID=UPI0026353DF4